MTNSCIEVDRTLWSQDCLSEQCEFMFMASHLKKSKGEVVTPTRWLDNHILYFVEKGMAGVKINDNTYTLTAAQGLWIPPLVYRTFFSLSPHPETQDYRLHFRLTLNGQHIVPANALRNPLRTKVNTLAPQFRKLHHLFHTPNKSPTHTFLQRALWLTLSHDFMEAKAAHQTHQRHLSEHQMGMLIQYAHTHLEEPILPQDLAKVLQLSQSYFTQMFKQTWGMSSREWLTQLRIQQACNYLQDGETTKAVAYAVGYKNISLFCRLFKAKMGLTPQEYKNSEVVNGH